MHADFYSLISSLITIPVYPDFVPESSALPAASYLLVSAPEERTLDDNADLQIEYWQLRITGNSREEASRLAVQFRTSLRVAKCAAYQRVVIDSLTDETRAPGVTAAAVRIDITATRRAADA
ncbi:TPA: hypothetical protein JS261_001129 [Escherichia coli]|nr:hypothetical protein [Escherichia coli]EKY6155077.1 hypothetical protein [Escherichia coli]ELO4340885.1 hypothetical protein [Escherichia coli]EMC3009619.1 hypothetical protein [Escherichia coli]EMC6800477.1 hypothetical protein [Escherichia coli]